MRHRGPVALHLLKIHPLTGQPLTPIGYRKDGRPIMPILGGAEDDDDEDDDKGGDDGGDSGDSGDKGRRGDDDDSGSDGGDNDTVSRAEFDAMKKRLQAADRRASALEEEKRKQDDAKKDELTRATDRVTELETEVSGLQETVSQLRIGNAFLSVNDHNWHDPDTALDLAERGGYLEDVVDDDGKVSQKLLKKALDRLAGDKPFLVKKAEKDDDDDRGPGSSGESGGGRSGNLKDEKAKREQMRKRFPVIR